jgi:hypothetical protein
VQKFTDKNGKEWTIEISIGSVRRVKAMLGIDLLDISGGNVLESIASDPMRLCDVVYCLCKPEADAAGVDDYTFGEGLGGDAIESAANALIEDLISFFPSRQRAILRKALAIARSQQEQLIELAETKVSELSDLAKIGGSSSSDLPSSPASLPETPTS